MKIPLFIRNTLPTTQTKMCISALIKKSLPLGAELSMILRQHILFTAATIVEAVPTLAPALRAPEAEG